MSQILTQVKKKLVAKHKHDKDKKKLWYSVKAVM